MPYLNYQSTETSHFDTENELMSFCVLLIYYVLLVLLRRRLRKYKSLPVRDSTTVYNELIDNHVSAPQPCKSWSLRQNMPVFSSVAHINIYIVLDPSRAQLHLAVPLAC